MTALLRLVGPAVAKYFGPAPDDLIDTIFDGIPMPVTAEVYPFFPATQIADQALSINGVERSFTSVSGQNPTWLQFNLGGDPDEIAGGINTLTVSVSDDAGSTTHFVLRYFRLAGGSNNGKLATTRPVTTTTTTTSPPLTKGIPGKGTSTPAPTPSPPLTTTKRQNPKGANSPKSLAGSGRRNSQKADRKGRRSRR
jgi:hypothetical protein